MPLNTLIADLAESLLLTSATILGADAPARQVVSWVDEAVPAGDCDELAVSMAQLWRTNSLAGRGAATPPQPRAQPSLPVATLRTRLTLACWKSLDAQGRDIPAAQVTATAVEGLTKTGALWLGVCQEANDGTLFADVDQLGGCLRAEVLLARPTPPQGGMISASFDVAVTIVHDP